MNMTKPINQLTGMEIRSFTPEQINAWTPEHIQQLTPPQLQTLTSTQLREMRPELIKALSPLQRSVLNARQLQAVMDAVLGGQTQINQLSQTQEAVTTDKQENPQPVVEAMFQMYEQGPELKLPQFETVSQTKEAEIQDQEIATTTSNEAVSLSANVVSNEKEIAVTDTFFVQPELAQQVAKTSNSARPVSSRLVKEKFSLTRSAVYMAVVALFSSGDFLVGAYSHENDLLIAVWEAHQQQVLANNGSNEVTTPITFKDEVSRDEAQKQLLQSESQVPSLTLPPESATESKTLASGLVLPPESATVSPRAIKPVTQPAPPVSQKPVAITLSAKTTSSTDNLIPNKRNVVITSRTVLNSVDLKSASDTYFKPTVLPTVQIAELTESQKKKQATLICTPAQAQSEQNTVIERLINEQPRNKVILASLGPNTQPVRISQAPVETAQAPNAAPKPGSSVAVTSSPAPSSTPTVSSEAQTRMREVSNVTRSDPDRYNSASWTSMKVSTDLPQKIAELGEDLISVVVSELPEKRKQQSAMPFDEFKLRVKEAVVANPDVRVEESKLGQSQASKSIAFAGMLPQVSGSAETGKRNVGRDPYLGTSAYTRNGTNYGVTVSQLLFDFGSSLFGFKAGEARAVAANELLNSKRSEQALKSISAFIEYERAKAQLALAKQNASSRLSIVRLVKERSQLGGGSTADIVRVESKYAEALSLISLSETRLNNAESAYREAFGVAPKDVVHGPLHEFPIEGLNKTAEELAGTYPGLLQLAKLREATQSEYNGAVAKTLPSFQLVYSNSIAGMNAPAPIEPARSNSLVFQLKYEFYTGGADTARKKDAMYKAQQALEEFESGMRAYQKVLSQSQSEIRNSDELIASRRVAANSAIDSMRAVREQFSFNKGSLLDLITVQEGLFAAGRDLIDAMADRALVRYRLLHLTAELDKMFEINNIASLNARD